MSEPTYNGESRNGVTIDKWSSVSSIDGHKVTYDSEADAGYLYLTEGEVARTVEVGNGVNVDLDQEGRIHGIESLNGPVSMSTLIQVLTRSHIVKATKHRPGPAENGGFGLVTESEDR